MAALKHMLMTISNKLHAKSKDTLTFKHPFPLEIWQLNLTEMSETSISVF